MVSGRDVPGHPDIVRPAIRLIASRCTGGYDRQIPRPVCLVAACCGAGAPNGDQLLARAGLVRGGRCAPRRRAPAPLPGSATPPLKTWPSACWCAGPATHVRSPRLIAVVGRERGGVKPGHVVDPPLDIFRQPIRPIQPCRGTSSASSCEITRVANTAEKRRPASVALVSTYSSWRPQIDSRPPAGAIPVGAARRCALGETCATTSPM